MKITWKRIITLFLAISIGVLPLCACSPDEPQPTPDPEPDPTPDPEPAPEPDPEPDPEPEPWLSEITTAPIKATRVLLANAPGGADGVTMGTLQGLAAKLSDTQILLRANSWTTYFPFMQAMGVKSSDKNEAGQAWDLSTLLAYYAPKLSGYILSSAESINVAISLSGVTNAVVVQPENEQKAKDAGLTMLLDVTDKDDTWLRKSEYFAKISRSVAVEQPASMAPKLVDYAVMAGAYFNFYDGKEGSEHTAMFDFLDDGAIVVGWNNTLGEYHTVKSLAGINACLIPADHAYNLSTLSSVAGEGKLNVERYAEEDADEPHVEDTAVHTVCIVMSDGDNLQWNLNDYTTSNKWYGSSLRGSFPMNWGVPALLGDLALPMMNYFSKTQSEEDEIIMQLSGLGYTFPSLWEADARADMAARVASSMEARGMKFMNILDDHGFNNETMDAFTWQDGIEGIFYTDYSNYAGYEGQILWSNDKPVVSARYRLWNGIAGCDPLKIARSINNAPANIYNEEAYSFIIVHAWSGLDGEGKLVPNGDTMAAVQELISLLDVDVEIVSASEFMARIKDNLAP